MKVAVLRETRPGEARVALVPELVGPLSDLGHTVVVQPGAGAGALHPDQDYRDAGASVSEGAPEEADLVLGVGPPAPEVLRRLARGSSLVCLVSPTGSAEARAVLREREVTAYAMEQVPRTSRAQPMDALSGQAMVTGYRGVVVAAGLLGRFLGPTLTASGALPAARVLVLGAGVAGLQAMTIARGTGAEVTAYDVRASAPAEIASVGAEPLDLGLPPLGGAAAYARELTPERSRVQQERLAPYVAAADVLVATAAVPGRRAPVLVSAAMVAAMAPGSVVVDLAAESGGNVEGSRPNETVRVGGVRVWGGADVPSQLPGPASRLYAGAVVNLVALLSRDGVLAPDPSDDLVAGACVVRGGLAVDEPPRPWVAPLSPALTVTSAGADEVAALLGGARRVVVVPGQGLAVAHAAHVLRGLGDALVTRGVEVRYAVHPVAGRLPGHLAGVLAEARVPAEQLVASAEVGALLPGTDVVLVVGANDVVNPAALSEPGTPLSGLAVVEAGRARRVVVLTRSLGPGFAGVANPLLADPATVVLLGDLTQTLPGLVRAVARL